MIEQEWTDEEKRLIREHTCPEKITDKDFNFFLFQCKRLQLDPMARQIYCVYRGNKLSVEPTIDGLTLIAERTGTYAGVDEPKFQKSTSENWRPATASVTVYRIVGGERCAFSWLVRWREYAPFYGQELAAMWKKMPFSQLAKCAFAAALRKAFPNELSGVYLKDEMEQAGEDVRAPSSNASLVPTRSERLPVDQREVPVDNPSLPSSESGSSNLKTRTSERKEPPASAATDFGGTKGSEPTERKEYSREEAKEIMAETARTAANPGSDRDEAGRVIVKSAETVREEFRQDKEKLVAPSYEEQFVTAASLLGMNWANRTPVVKHQWAFNLLDAADEKDCPPAVEMLNNTHYIRMYQALHNYLIATEGIPKWMEEAGIKELWEDLYGNRAPFPKSLYRLSGRNWKNLADQLKYKFAQSKRRGEFFAVADEAGLWDIREKSKEEISLISQNMRDWMSEILGIRVRSRSLLTPEEWGLLTQKLREEYNDKLSHNAEPETFEESIDSQVAETSAPKKRSTVKK